MGRYAPLTQKYDYYQRLPLTRERHLLSPDHFVNDYAILYGGIDSNGVTERARDLTSVMLGVAKRHAVEVSCPIVLREFHLLPDEGRKLFGGLDITATPEQPGGERAIRETLAVLHDRLLGIRVSTGSAEVTAAYDFLVEVWNHKRETGTGILVNYQCWIGDKDYFFADVPGGDPTPGFTYPNPEDPDHIGKTWMVVLAAMLMDFRYLHL